jgi:hypothetical protein
VIPRLAFTGFCFAQPFLVERVLDFMGEPEHVNSDNYARGLVVAYGIVYVGLAVCECIQNPQKDLANLTSLSSDIICNLPP